MDMREYQVKKQIEEYGKHPGANFADSINRGRIGEPGALPGIGSLFAMIFHGIRFVIKKILRR